MTTVIIYMIIGCIFGILTGYIIDKVLESDELREEFKEEDLLNIELNKNTILIRVTIFWLPLLVIAIYKAIIK